MNNRPKIIGGALLLLVLTAISPVRSRAQDVWRTLRPANLDSGNYALYSLSACDDHNFTACGWFATKRKLAKPVIVRTSDGGETWVVQDPKLPGNGPDKRQLRKVFMIDSLHIIAVGDSGTIIKSADGGTTWIRKDYDQTTNLANVEFSDSSNGMIVGGSGVILLTSDGGTTWKPVPNFPAGWIVNCHAYGAGKYRLYAYGDGPIYTTTDNFKTWDSVRIFDYHDTLHGTKNINGCLFLGRDSIIAYGWWAGVVATPGIYWSYLLLSVDGGRTWRELIARPTHVIWELTSVATSGSGVWLAGGRGAGCLYSKDEGSTWVDDTLRIQGPQVNLYTQLNSIQILSPTRAIALGGWEVETAIVDLTLSNLSVQSFEHIVYSTRVYPNPATDYVNIQSDIRSQPIYLMDVLGREVTRDVLDANGALRLDLTHLSGGVYQVAMDYNGKRIHITNLVVLR